MAKRENGEGSVYKRKDIKRRPWVVALPASYSLDEQGKMIKKQEILGHYASSKEAKAALAHYLEHPVVEINMTVDDLHTLWLSRAEYKNLAKQSKDCYNAAWKKIPEDVKAIKMRELRTEDMQSCIDAHLEQSGTSLSYIKSSFSRLYALALERDICHKDYSKFVKLPKKKKNEIHPFNAEEVEKIKKAAENRVPYADVILILIYTGFRISELLALTPDDYIIDEQILIGGLKTEAGENRHVPVLPIIKPYIERRLNVGGQKLICKDDGTGYSSCYMRKKYYDALDAIGVRRLSPHSCRKTCATMMVENGVTPEATQMILGHEEYSTTLKYYALVSDETLQKEMSKIS